MSRRDAAAGERGQVTVLVIGFTVVAALLIGLVVVATRAYLTRRDLWSYADGAAVTAAQAVSEAAVYEEGIAGSVPLDARRADAAVREFLARTAVAQQFAGFRILDVSLTRDGVVRVSLGAVSPVPFVDAVTGSYAGGVPITVEATAEAELLGP